jgi:flavin reductase (DIM6/NTAB) family NADH-FMN oxidoreductase RutF
LAASERHAVTVAPDTFRQLLGSFASGVTVVTTRAGDEVHGTTMSAFCSVSLAPPLVLVCVDKTAACHDIIQRGGVFAVNILHQGQADLSTTLSRKGTPELEAAHRLEGVPFRIGATGAPILQEHLAYLDCRIAQEVDAGDHTVFIGQIEEGGVSRDVDAPLVYFRGRYGKIRLLE